ncbi:MAG TPA: hypothetical protein PK069_02045 [Methanolinea sp.]|nr:hypothetical protein [Methanolinea sp.]
MRTLGVRFPVLLAIALFLFCGIAIAHSPSDLRLDYDQGTSTLRVTVTHQVDDSSSHYVREVVIQKNGVTVDTVTYASQPSRESFTYSYPLTLDPGDLARVTARCNIGGFLTREYTRPSAQGQPSTAIPTTPLMAPSPWVVHAALLLAAIFLFLGVSVLPTYGKGITGWYRYHTVLAMIGGILAILAIAMVFVGIPSETLRNAWDAHVALGLIVLAILLFTLGAGIYRKWAGGHKGEVRTVHLWLGRVLVVLVLVNVVLGLSAVGIF